MQIVDVAPTLLYALGVPISVELEGNPLLGVFRPEFVSSYPVRRVASYGAPNAPSAVRRGQPLDDEMIERLRSLGYVR
jgi:arylsulfatase A-like enzyme